MVIGAFDTSTRMRYPLFLPFLLQARGGGPVSVGLGLALLFAEGIGQGRAAAGSASALASSGTEDRYGTIGNRLHPRFVRVTDDALRMPFTLRAKIAALDRRA